MSVKSIVSGSKWSEEEFERCAPRELKEALAYAKRLLDQGSISAEREQTARLDVLEKMHMSNFYKQLPPNAELTDSRVMVRAIIQARKCDLTAKEMALGGTAEKCGRVAFEVDGARLR